MLLTQTFEGRRYFGKKAKLKKNKLIRIYVVYTINEAIAKLLKIMITLH